MAMKDRGMVIALPLFVVVDGGIVATVDGAGSPSLPEERKVHIYHLKKGVPRIFGINLAPWEDRE